MLLTCDAASTAHSLLSSVFAAHHLTIKLCDHQNLWYSLSLNRDTSLSISNPPSRFTTVHSLAKDCVLTKQHHKAARSLARACFRPPPLNLHSVWWALVTALWPGRSQSAESVLFLPPPCWLHFSPALTNIL